MEWFSWISFRRYSDVAASFDLMTSIFCSVTIVIFKNSTSSSEQVAVSSLSSCSSLSETFAFWDNRFCVFFKYLILLYKYPPPFESHSRSWIEKTIHWLVNNFYLIPVYLFKYILGIQYSIHIHDTPTYNITGISILETQTGENDDNLFTELVQLRLCHGR